MEPRPPGPKNPDVCYGNWDCVEDEQQWMRDHPNGEISQEEQEAMDNYASEEKC